jgi:hypothetical protein
LAHGRRRGSPSDWQAFLRMSREWKEQGDVEEAFEAAKIEALKKFER